MRPSLPGCRPVQNFDAAILLRKMSSNHDSPSAGESGPTSRHRLTIISRRALDRFSAFWPPAAATMEFHSATIFSTGQGGAPALDGAAVSTRSGSSSKVVVVVEVEVGCILGYASTVFRLPESASHLSADAMHFPAKSFNSLKRPRFSTASKSGNGYRGFFDLTKKPLRGM